jgi:hypothetical protein
MFEWCFWLVAFVVHADAWLCILSSPPCVGHQVVMVYILSGGVPNRLPASWVMLLARHCLHIPSPVGYFWSTRANHGGIKVQKDQKACWFFLVVNGSCTVADSIDVASYFYLLMWVDVSFKGNVTYPRGHVSSIALYSRWNGCMATFGCLVLVYSQLVESVKDNCGVGWF